MFGTLRGFFAALGRLTASINRSADLWDAANAHLEQQLGFGEKPAALEHDQGGEGEKVANGRKGKR